jgi:ankyrin repeat protein
MIPINILLFLLIIILILIIVDIILISSSQKKIYNGGGLMSYFGFNPSSANSSPNRLLEACYNKKSPENIQIILHSGVDVNLQDSNGDTALIIACKQELQSDTIQKILATNINVNLQNNANQTALMVACKNKLEEPILLLLGVPNITVNLQDSGGNTALMVACYYQAPHICIKSLLDHGADQNIRNKNNKTALIFACKKKSQDTISLLLISPRIEDVVNVQGSDGNTALILACEQELPSDIITALLVVPNIDVNLKNKNNKTALIFACEKKSQDTILLLLRNPNINVNLQDANGNTALMVACCYQGLPSDIINIINALLAAPDINVNLKNSDGNTALILACENKLLPGTIQSLLKYGADPNIKNNRNKMALTYACEDYKYNMNIDILLNTALLGVFDEIDDDDGYIMDRPLSGLLDECTTNKSLSDLFVDKLEELGLSKFKALTIDSIQSVIDDTEIDIGEDIIDYLKDRMEIYDSDKIEINGVKELDPNFNAFTELEKKHDKNIMFNSLIESVKKYISNIEITYKIINSILDRSGLNSKENASNTLLKIYKTSDCSGISFVKACVESGADIKIVEEFKDQYLDHYKPVLLRISPRF